MVLLVAWLPSQAAAGQVGNPEPSVVPAASLQQRMDGFLAAVRSRDADSMVAFFPQTGEWRYLHTVHSEQGSRTGAWLLPAADTREAITRGDLAQSFRIHGEAQTIGLFAHQVRGRPGQWRLVSGRRFVPPGAGMSSSIFVTWRRENGKWVISSLADESFGRGPLPTWCC